MLLLSLAALPLALAAYTPFHGRDYTPLAPRDGTPVCVVKAGGSNTTDDSPAFLQAVQNCSSNAVIQFASGVNYYLNTPVNATLNNVEVQMFGNIHLPQNITAIQAIVNQSSVGTVYWMTLTGNNIKYTGTTNVTTGWIYGYGQQWWDANKVNGTGLAARPHLLKFNATTGLIWNLKVRKPIAWVVGLYGNDITVQNTFIEATTTRNGGFPFNTDGFDVTATNVLIEDAEILNGDDAVTVENGANNVTVRNILMAGPGSHGMSVGSLGQTQSVYNRVSNILFTDITAVNSVYGARFKSWVGGQGLAQNITWQNFYVQNVTFPIYVTQNYINQGSAQTQNSAEGSNSTSTVNGRVNNATVVMQNFSWSNWKGTVNTYQPGDGSCVTNPCWYDEPGTDGTQSIVIRCTNSTSCGNFQLRNIQVVPQSQVPPTAVCNNLANSNSPQLGFTCTNSSYIPTA